VNIFRSGIGEAVVRARPDRSRNIFRVTRVEQEVKSEGDWTPTPTGDRVRGRSSVPHRIGNQRKRAGAHGWYRRLGKIVLSHLVIRSRAGYLFVVGQCSEKPLEARNARADAEPGWRGIGPTAFFTAALPAIEGEIGSALRRSREVTHLCSDRVTHAKNRPCPWARDETGGFIRAEGA
jgi:hypothetical protein